MGYEVSLRRESGETRIEVELTLYGRGGLEGGTGLGFFDHMLEQLAFYSGMDLRVWAEWDLAHHLIEDLMYLLGKAVAEALGDRRGIRRFGWSAVPMDESLVLTSVDLGGRVYSSVDFSLQGQVEGVDVSDLAHGVESLARGLGATVHLLVLRRGNPHHVVEAGFKSLGMSLRTALERTGGEVRSTKGVLDL